MNIALFIVFLSIFVATAVITLASLPGWIKIPDSYRKALFSALLLEVIACVIFLFKDSFGQHEAVEVIKTETSNNAAVIYNLHREVNPEQRVFIDYVLKKDSINHGKVSIESMKALGLFDTIKTDNNAFARVKFTEAETGWSRENGIDKKWDIDIRMENFEYVITDKKNTVEYASGKNFNKSQRGLHFVKASDKKFYLITISDAKLDQSPKFISFFILQFEPNLKMENLDN